MKFKIKELGNGAVEVALGAGATIVGLHAVRKMPKYAGWVMLGAGLLGYVIAGGMEGNEGVIRVTKTVSVIAASVGAVSALNQIAQDGGVPAVTGFKGAINKVVPQLAGVGMLGMGNVEDFNENLLGELAQEELSQTDLDDLTGNDGGEPDYTEQLLGVGSLM